MGQGSYSKFIFKYTDYIYSQNLFFCLGLDFCKEMEMGDKNPETLRNLSHYKIGYEIVHQNCQKKGGGGFKAIR